MIEIWKDVVGYEGLYQVSNLGSVKSKNKVLNPYVNRKGYQTVSLSKKSKVRVFKVARLVYLTFNGLSYYNNLSVNHIDFNTLNNNLDNLELLTLAENTIYSWKNNRHTSFKEVYLIKNNKKILYKSHRDLAKELGRSVNYISTKLFRKVATVTYKNKKTIYTIQRKDL
jgi:hypothetical protein